MTITLNGTTGITTPTTSTTGEFVTSVTGFKNRIINGAMVFDQRNAGASVTPTNSQYSIDRWAGALTTASKFTMQQNAGAVTPPVGFTKYLGITSSSAYSVGSGETFAFFQSIEGFNIADFAWGTANATTVTLSFLAYSSLTGTFGGSIFNGDATRSYTFSYTISSANTWTTISVTIAGDTSGTWSTNNSPGLGVRFGLGSGSTFSGTAYTWQAGNLIQPTGTVSVVGTSGATFYITGVQLEKGSTATSFDYLDYGRSLIQCQRYFEMSYPQGIAPGTASQQTTSLSVYNNSPTASTAATMTIPVRFKASKRASPTVTIYQPTTGATGVMRNNDTGASIVSAVFLPSQEQCSLVSQDGTNGCTSNQPLVGHFTASAEL